MKILFLDHAPVMGGAEMSLLDILVGLNASASVDPVLLAPSQGKLYSMARERGLTVMDFSGGGGILSVKRADLERNPLLLISGLPRVVSAAWKIRNVLRKGGYGAVYTNTLKSHLLGGLAGRMAGVKVIWHFRDIPVQRWSRLISRIGAAILPDRIIAVSQAVALQFGRDRATVIYNGLNLVQILRQAEEQLPNEMPGRLWLCETRPVIGLVGQISRWKGQDVFLKAAHLLAEKLPEARFLIVGDAIFGEEGFRNELENYANRSGLEGMVAFTGYLNNPYPLMKRLDLLAHCSVEPEPFGRVLVESLALGVPVVASRTGASSEIIQDGVNGLLVPPGDPEALARGLEAVLVRIEEYQRKSRASADRFDLSPMLESITSVLLEKA